MVLEHVGDAEIVEEEDVEEEKNLIISRIQS